MLSIQYPVKSASALFVPSRKHLSFVVPIVEGAKELEAIAPINHLTGDRLDPIELLNVVLSPSRKEMLQRFLQDVPTLRSMNGLSDEDMLSMIPERLSTGKPAEDALFAKQLASIADVALPTIRKMVDLSLSNSVDSSDDDFNSVKVDPE